MQTDTFIDSLVDSIGEVMGGRFKVRSLSTSKTEHPAIRDKWRVDGVIETDIGPVAFFAIEDGNPASVHVGFSVLIGTLKDPSAAVVFLLQNSGGFGPPNQGAFFSATLDDDQSINLWVETHRDLDTRDLKNQHEAIDAMMGKIRLGWLAGLSEFDWPEMKSKLGNAVE